MLACMSSTAQSVAMNLWPRYCRWTIEHMLPPHVALETARKPVQGRINCAHCRQRSVASQPKVCANDRIPRACGLPSCRCPLSGFRCTRHAHQASCWNHWKLAAWLKRPSRSTASDLRSFLVVSRVILCWVRGSEDHVWLRLDHVACNQRPTKKL